MLEKLAKENADKVRIVKVDVSAHPDWARQEQIRGVPTFQFYLSGTKVEQFAGAPPEHILKGKIDHHASKVLVGDQATAAGAEGGEPAAEPAIRPMPKEWLPPGVTRQ